MILKVPCLLGFFPYIKDCVVLACARQENNLNLLTVFLLKFYNFFLNGPNWNLARIKCTQTGLIGSVSGYHLQQSLLHVSAPL